MLRKEGAGSSVLGIDIAEVPILLVSFFSIKQFFYSFNPQAISFFKQDYSISFLIKIQL